MSRYAGSSGAFHFDGLPGQPQVAHCHGFFVPVGLRGQGNGHELKRTQMELLAYSLFDYAICTVDRDNLAQQAILTQAGWSRLTSFSNSKTGGSTELWGCSVTQEPHHE